MKANIEELKRNKLIPQYNICQKCCPTQKFSGLVHFCIKCTGKHLTAGCAKPVNTTAKRAKCSEAHLANYRGCINKINKR